jgi:drug/metabolite transporter (DMT)-like permease
VQLIAARWVFHENIAPAQWAGSALIVAGIVLVSFNALP